MSEELRYKYYGMPANEQNIGSFIYLLFEVHFFPPFVFCMLLFLSLSLALLFFLFQNDLAICKRRERAEKRLFRKRHFNHTTAICL